MLERLKTGSLGEHIHKVHSLELKSKITLVPAIQSNGQTAAWNVDISNIEDMS